MCVLSIKVLIRKKSGNLFNDPHSTGAISNLLKEMSTHCIAEKDNNADV